MSYKLSKQPLSKKIFNDDYTRKIHAGGSFGDVEAFRNSYHHGVDYGANVGEGLHTIFAGRTKFTTSTNSQLERDFGNFFGYYVPEYDVTISYAHMSSVSGYGNLVEGELVGKSGNSGKSTGPHVDVMIARGERNTLQEVYNNAFDFETFIPTASGSDGDYINLKPLSNKPRYGFYKTGVVPVAKNISGYLEPYNLGGISYEILRKQSNDVVIVGSRDFGEIQLYVDSSRASITDSPEYKVYGGGDSAPAPEPTPEPAKPSRTGQTLVIYGSSLQGSQEVPLRRRDGSSYGAGAGIVTPRGQVKKYKIIEEITDGFYNIHVPNANPQSVYVNWQVGIGFED